MPASYLHGVETIEIDKGPRPVQLVKTAVIGIVGTAAAGPVNTPILVSNERDFAQFGEDIAGSTILDALQHIYQQKGTVCVVVNVLDPAIHKTSVVDEVVNVAADGSFRTSRPAIAAVSIKSANGATVYTAGTDYQIDLRSGRGQRIGNGAIAASTVAAPTQLKISYSYADATKVTPADVIGSVGASGQRLGMKALRDSYALFGFYPKILIAPVFASLASVSAELIATATALRAISFIDAPIGVTPQQAITGRGPAGSINFNTSSDRVGLCYPYLKAFDASVGYDRLRPLSSFAAGAQSRKDQDNGYWWSLSNTELLGATGVERPIDAMINDPNCEANLLNAAGVITVFNSFGTGLRIWGNRSAAFPASTHPKNFLCVRRVADVIAESLEYFTLQYSDRPLDNALVDDVVESGNRFLRKLKADGAIIDGRAWYDPAQNDPTELAAGHLTITYDFMPPTPAERVSYRASINIDYLNQLGKKA
ncbi:phage tail protein [Herbaspirillum seropedicae]|uniref:Bacteriophage contractile tail sheath protein n=1 Tax=Herbaspirillum seropedicae (strain SmR1) TaxID=757424 RepID=D8IV27_HERSS|nr:phage tail sheath subtilisin-like domain-containing protein [Herbaspirillum seropedicae]ADJ61746.1 bacteriophage contractile tail sheath protein [Herbaspirillum seropedicae SmR1]AKN63946.1 tail protein [Herbaspirillum seropedicae]NQE29318.1 tail protein [Herbaspirillum seropedicae]UMU19858.1 phage tail protein [Herbaspirillum seropedicae]